VRRLLIAVPLITALLLAIAIGFLNRDPVSFNFLFAIVEMRLATLLALTLLLGGGLGALAMLWPLARLRWRLARLVRQQRLDAQRTPNQQP